MTRLDEIRRNLNPRTREQWPIVGRDDVQLMLEMIDRYERALANVVIQSDRDSLAARLAADALEGLG